MYATDEVATVNIIDGVLVAVAILTAHFTAGLHGVI